jgi:Cu2+-exporting ATPase/Cu+-exporting ATPase
VTAGDTLPAEGELLNESGHFSLAWISGELESKTFLRGAVVPAGARVQSSAEFKVTKLLPETPFGKILHEVQKFNLSKNRLVSKADTWAQWLLVSVFSVALLFLALYWNVSSADAIQRSLALIILACPCAMAFGTPLALAAALKKAQAAGLIIRNANVFENIRKINTIFLDKTGTLTETELSLINSKIPLDDQKIILALENNSQHPMAFAFRRAFSCSGELPQVQNLKETPGYGVSGNIFGKEYYLISGAAGSGLSCELVENGAVKHKFSFTAELKPDSLAAVEELRLRGYRVCLLSGDRKDSVLDFGAQLGFTLDDIFYGADPARKAEVVGAHPGAMMVGDGMNDSLAMIKAEVGVATSGGVEAALRSSDVYLTRPSLRQILTLIDVSKESLALIRQNLLISVIYNGIGGTLALAGYVNPFVAAVLMPVSSGFIILSTWLRSRR